jgi:hypothetical protein
MKNITRKFFSGLSVLVVLTWLVTSVPAIASDISDAQWYGDVVVTNNSSSTATNTITYFTVNNSAMINEELLNSSANNCAFKDSSGTDIPFMLDANKCWLFRETLSAQTNQTDIFYTGNVTGGKMVYIPGSSGMTIADTLTEPGNDFSWTFTDLFLNADSTNKTGLFSHYDSVNGGILGGINSGTATVAILPASGASSNSTAYRPESTGTHTNLTPSAGANYACSGDNNDATYVDTSSSSYVQDTYKIPDCETDIGVVNSVTIYLRVKNGTTDNGCYYKPLLLTHSILYEGTEGSAGYTATYITASQTFTTNPNTATKWTWDEINALEIGAELKNLSGTTSFMADCWIVINYYTPVSVSVNGITSSEYNTATISLTGGTFSFDVDGSSNSTAFAGSVPNSSANWTLFGGETVYFVESATYSQGGAPVSAWGWEYGTTFHDSIGSNDATPSFRTAGNNPDVYANLTSFGPLTQAQASSMVDTEGNPWPGAPDKPTGFTTPSGRINIFFYDLLHGLFQANATYGTAAESVFWYLMSLIVILLGGFFAQKYGKSIVIKAFAMGALMLGGALSNVYGIWTLVVYVCYAFGIIIMSRHYGF